MNNRMQGEEDVGFNNELTPEQINQILAMAKSMPELGGGQPDRMPANMGESADLNQMMGMPPKRFPSPFAPDASQTGMPQQTLPQPSFDPSKYMSKAQPTLPSPTPMPSTQEQINPEDMEMLNKILMGQGQGEMPSPTPSPMASPFRNIRGTIDRSR